MSTEAAKMRIEFEVGAGGVEDGIAIANTSIDQFLDRLKRIPGGTDGGERSTRKFTDTLKEFKAEQTANSRTAAFFASQLASIIPGAEGATGALKSLINVGLEGFGIGVALEATMFILEQVGSALKDQEREAQELRKIHRDTWRAASDSLEDYQHGLSTTASEVDNVWRGISNKVRDQVRSVQDQIDDYQNSLAAKFRNYAGVIPNFLFGAGFSSGTVIDTVQQKIDKLVAKQSEAKGTLTDPTILQKKQEAADAEGVKKHREFLREQVRLEAETDDEIARILADLSSKKHGLFLKDFKDADDLNARRVTLEAEAAEKIRRLREDRDREDAARRRTAQAANGTETEKLDAEHENRLEELRDEIRRTSLSKEQQRIRQEIADETAAYLAKRDLLERERDARLRAGAEAVDRKKYDESLGFLKIQADIEDAARARHEAGGNEQLAQDLLRIQQEHDRERADLETLYGEKKVSAQEYQRYVADLDDRSRIERLKAFGDASGAGEFVNPLVQNWQQGLEQMLSGTYQWSNLTRNVLASVVGSFAQGASKIATDWLAQEALKFAGWAAFKVKELVLHSATEEGKTIATAANAAQRIPIEAAEAGVLAGQSAAAIPGIGWLIALPAAGAVVGGLIALGLSSASGGYDIGAENPITQLHAREMVLPAHIADPLRESLANGGPGGGGDTYQVTVQAVDAAGFERVLQNNEAAVVKFVSQAHKKNRLKT
jgi:hypothetical protein